MKKKKLNILYEDKHLLIVYKNDNIPTIKSVKYKNSLYERVFVVHRLDKDTSGLVVFAKSESVKELLQNNWDKVTRNYIAIVHGKTKDNDTIESYLKETKTLYTYSTNDKTGKYAKTEYKKVDSNDLYTLIEINIKTGRKNQIRVQLSDINHPIVGDKKYGCKHNIMRRMALHAYLIEFEIKGKKYKFETKLPKEFQRMFNI